MFRSGNGPQDALEYGPGFAASRQASPSDFSRFLLGQWPQLAERRPTAVEHQASI